MKTMKSNDKMQMGSGFYTKLHVLYTKLTNIYNARCLLVKAVCVTVGYEHICQQ